MGPEDCVDVRECRNLMDKNKMEVDTKVSKLHEKVNKAVQDIKDFVILKNTDTNDRVDKVMLAMLGHYILILATLLSVWLK